MKEIQKRYEKEMDHLFFTKDEKETLIQKVQQNTAAAKRKTYLPKRSLVAAAILICIVSACAYGVLRTASESFAPLYGTKENALLDEIGQPIGVSNTSHGVTITADAVVGDKHHVYMMYTMERKDGKPLDIAGADLTSLQFSNVDTAWPQGDINVQLGVQSTGCRFVQQENNRLSFISTKHTENPIPNGKWFQAKFENLCYWDDVQKKIVPLIDGTWTLRYQLDYVDAGITIPVEQTFTREGMDFTVNTITLSPIAVQVDYTTNDVPLTWKPKEEKAGFTDKEIRQDTARFIHDIEWLLTKKDGSVLNLEIQDLVEERDKIPAGGSHLSPQKKYSVIQRSFAFPTIIPLEEIASITLGDVVIDIPSSLQ